MLERFATEKQRRAAKGAAFNLNDDDELLTHYGQSLSGLDDLADIRLPEDDDDDEGKSQSEIQQRAGQHDKGLCEIHMMICYWRYKRSGLNNKSTLTSANL